MNNTPSSLPARGFRGLPVLFAFTLAAIALPAAETDEVLKLPDLTIHGAKDLPLPEAWLYGRLEDGTEVLTNAGERASGRLLRDFQMFQQALEVVWPMPAAEAPARTLILCGRLNKFADFTPPGHNDGDTGSASLFLRNREQAAIVVDLQAATITLSGLQDDSGALTSNFEVDAYRQLYREYVRYLLSQGDPPPAWLQEGLCQIVMAMEFTPEWIIFGKIDSSAHQRAPAATDPAAAPDDGTEAEDPNLGTAAVGDRPFNVALQRRALIPLEQFFAVTADAPETRNPLGNNRWAKQAYAFVHLCLYGENGRYQQAFARFVQRLRTEPPSESLFKECFGTDYRSMLLTLRGYIQFTRHTYKTYKLKPGGRRLGGEPVALREASQGEVGHIKGDAQWLAGETERALFTYREAYARGERDPALLAGLGTAEGRAGHTDRAIPLLETALKAGPARPAVQVELARQRLAAALYVPGAVGGRLTDAQLAGVLPLLLQARQQRPARPETYEVLAEAWLAAAQPPKTEHLAILVEGLRLFPKENLQFLRTAELYLRAGNPTTAGALAKAGLQLAKDDATRARFAELLAGLPATPAQP